MKKELFQYIGRTDILKKDFENKSIVVTIEDCSSLLQKALEDKEAITKISELAEYIELNDDNFIYQDGYEDVIADILFQLSTPEINIPLTKEHLIDLLNRLNKYPISN